MGSRKWYQSHTENQVGLDLYISDMLYSLRVTFKKKWRYILHLKIPAGSSQAKLFLIQVYIIKFHHDSMRRYGI